jgi:hypothetical protein
MYDVGSGSARVGGDDVSSPVEVGEGGVVDGESRVSGDGSTGSVEHDVHGAQVDDQDGTPIDAVGRS